MQIAVGSYTGNGVDGTEITGVGFQPDLVIIQGGSNRAVWRSSSHTGDDSSYFFQVNNAVNLIQSLTSDGFTVGDDATVNTNSTAYRYAAFKDNGANDFKVGTYTGNGSDGRNITEIG